MKRLHLLRVVLGLLVSVLIPVEQAHCGFMQPFADSVVALGEKQGGGDDHCCPEKSPTSAPAVPANPPCCGSSMQLPPSATPVTVSLAAPAKSMTLSADLPPSARSSFTIALAQTVPPEARSGSPPDPSSAPQAPRSPPHSA